MSRRWWFALVILTPGLTGCTPDGPPEFYRTGLQTRSEFVDSLSRVVDESSAKTFLATDFKLAKERFKDVQEALEADKKRLEPSWGRIRSDRFDPKKLDADDRGRMIVSLRAYHGYCKNLVYTNVRLGRELRRLEMLANLYVLSKAKSQLAANQEVSVSREAECPKLADLLKKIDEVTNTRLEVLPGTFTVEHLTRLESGLDKEQLQLVVEFDPKNLKPQGVQLEPPPLPQYQSWAVEVDQRAKLGLTRAR